MRLGIHVDAQGDALVNEANLGGELGDFVLAHATLHDETLRGGGASAKAGDAMSGHLGSVPDRLRLELHLALDSPAGAFAFLALLGAAAVALCGGIEQVSAQHSEIGRALEQQAEQRAEDYPPGFEPQDAGLVGYALFHVAADPPGPWAFVAQGTRAGANVLHRIRLLGLEAQIHDGELSHPELAAAGSFDFAFVVIFLLPLALIASLHDLRSGEAEAGRLPLLNSTMLRPQRFWALRVGIRLALVLGATMGPLLMVVLLTGAPLSRLIAIVLAVSAYAVLWTLVACAVALRHRVNSVSSAVTLLCIWSLGVLVLPGVVGAFATWAYPAEQGAEITLAQRLKVNDAWDRYFAFHEAGDRSVASEVAAYEQTLRRRERFVELASLVAPPLAVQRVLTAAAETDVSRRWAHRTAVRKFHAELRDCFYPMLFDEIPFTEAELNALPQFAPAPRRPRHEPWALAGLALFTGLAGVLLRA